MYLVSGCNLFGQWFSGDFFLTNFKNISACENDTISKYFKNKPSQVKLLEINWSYNIFQIDGAFYISGSWLGKENQFVKFEIPDDDECRRCFEGDGIQNMTLVGNDYYLILIHNDNYKIWVVNLEKNNEVRKLKLNIDKPIKTVGMKRFRVHDKIVKVVTTNNNTLYLTENGVIYSGLVPTYLHIQFAHRSKICDIASGYDHFIMLTDTGRVYTWGNGRRLQLGHGDLTNLESPVEVGALAGVNIVKISAGGWHSLALSDCGDLYSWGWNDTGQLGIKSQPDSPQGVLKTDGLKSYPHPTLVDFFDENDAEVDLNVKDIACGSRHSAILLEDNTVWTSGNNKYGQLGFDPEQYANVDYFKKVFHCEDKFKLECGLWTTVLIKDD